MNSTANFAKNFIILDYSSQRTKDKLATFHGVYKSVELCNIISPNLILHSIYGNFLELNLSIMNNSYVFHSLMTTFKTTDKNITNELLLHAANNTSIELHAHFNNLRNSTKKVTFISEVEYIIYNEYVTGNDHSQHDNNTLLMEISLLISHYASTFDENLKNLSEFINKISKNSIKVLSFISIGIFAYYAKMYATFNDNLYKKEKWMNRLIDLFTDGSIKKYLNNIDNNEYRKFMFMIIKYTVITENMNTNIPYARIHKIKQCFLTDFDSKYEHSPGYTADQLFLISYDLFMSSHNWMLFVTSATLIYTELSHVNIIMSWYYFTLNNDDISKFFDIKGSEDQLGIFKNNIIDLTLLMTQVPS